jgi:exodeoxyribonuclease VII large subunit
LSEIQHIKLSDLTQKIRQVITNSFGTNFYWIIAEISGHKFYPNQDRHYFEFVEKSESSSQPIAKVKGVSWSQGSQRIKIFENETGQIFGNDLQVLVKVKVEFHSAYGFTLVVQDIDPSFTLGNLEKQRRETLERLLREDSDVIQKVGEEYVTRNKKIVINRVIQSIAVIGSPNSEGYIDFSHNIKNNKFNYTFSTDIYQSSVQGASAERELVNKLLAIYDSGKKYDCVVIIRGGGAKTDFLVFDNYHLARAVARFPIPIITGIGHHKDVSIVDLMANTSTKTPTKAAEFIVSHNRTFEDEIIVLQKTVIIKSQQLLGNSLQRINATNIIIINKSRTFISSFKDQLTHINQIVINKTKTILYNRQTNLVALLNQLLSRPKIIRANRQSELENLMVNLKGYSTKYLTNQRGFLGHYISIIKLMSPSNILKKGFAVVSKGGMILTNAEALKAGDELTISMEKYDVITEVKSKTKTDGAKFDL